MTKTDAFDEHASAYDAWFEDHQGYYKSELNAVRHLMPDTGKGIEIGIGTGRFAIPLGINDGIEPSSAMRRIAQEKGINAIDGVAENLPIETDSFDYALFVTTICFLDSLDKAFSEAYRILKKGGFVVIGFIEKESVLGKKYQNKKNESRFYQDADFHTVDEVVRVLELTGFVDFSFAQTLFSEEDGPGTIQAVKDGCGEGAFVVVRAKKPADERMSN